MERKHTLRSISFIFVLSEIKHIQLFHFFNIRFRTSGLQTPLSEEMLRGELIDMHIADYEQLTPLKVILRSIDLQSLSKQKRHPLS